MRRKKKLPKTSSSRCPAHRRQRQWRSLYAGFPGLPLRAVFPSVVVRPVVFGILAVLYQKDSTTLVDNHGSGMCTVGFTGYDALCVFFPSGVAKPKMLRILARMNQIMVQTAETVVVPQL